MMVLQETLASHVACFEPPTSSYSTRTLTHKLVSLS